jgi:hypothetical protein
MISRPKGVKQRIGAKQEEDPQRFCMASGIELDR